MKVNTIMTAAVKSCQAQTNLAAIAAIMWDNDCGVVPVVDERGQAIGIVTDRDICIALGTRDVRASTLTARDVMSSPVVGCVPEDDCIIVLLTMVEHRVHRLPVLGPNAVVIGLVSLDDIVRRAAAVPAGDPLRHGILDVLAAIGGHKVPIRARLATA
ncbi:MAG: CBS domain-containing protein [Vicinamibacteraceae bacterium]